MKGKDSALKQYTLFTLAVVLVMFLTVAAIKYVSLATIAIWDLLP